MDVLTAAIFQRLSNDSELAGLLADGAGSVYTDDRVPPDAALPYVVSAGNVADEPWDTKTSQGRRPTRDVGVYFPHRSTKTLEQAAERVRALLHRHPLAIDGHRTVTARVSGPIRISSDDYDARVLTLRLGVATQPDD